MEMNNPGPALKLLEEWINNKVPSVFIRTGSVHNALTLVPDKCSVVVPIGH